jgi:hypothetical protein
MKVDAEKDLRHWATEEKGIMTYVQVLTRPSSNPI